LTEPAPGYVLFYGAIAAGYVMFAAVLCTPNDRGVLGARASGYSPKNQRPNLDRGFVTGV